MDIQPRKCNRAKNIKTKKIYNLIYEPLLKNLMEI